MKRHKSLYPLSHDHHHALVQAKNLRMASSSSDISSLYRIAIDFIAYWDTSLQLHFRQEEEILLPVLSQYSSPDHLEIIGTLKQHGDIQQVVSQLRKNIEQEAVLAEEGQKLSALLSMHIRYEEQYLFPAIQDIVPEEALWEINRHLTEK